MAERIYTMRPEGRLEPLEEAVFPTEDELQALIADHPELLNGEQIAPGDPRRWVLVTREKSIAESAGTSGRWAVDHLMVDQDAVPTLVDVKRGENPEIRRTIVGQMLEYAAHAAATWSKDELRRSFEESCRNQARDPEQVIGDLLGPDEEASTDWFWDEVARNLAANRLRLLFVADKIPEPLKRVAEFLNAQMPGIEVFTVEVKRFGSGESQALVPRVFGTTASSRPLGRGPSLTREVFLDDFGVEAERDAATQLLNVARDAGATFAWGPSAVSIRVICHLWPQPVAVAWLYPPSAAAHWMRTRAFTFGAAILDEGLDERLRAVLKRWTGEFNRAPFTDASSKGVSAWAIKHSDATGQIDLLAPLLAGVIAEIHSL